MLPLRDSQKLAFAIFVVAAGTLVFYYGVLFPRDSGAIYPWSSDAWGHYIKSVYLREQVAQGIWYPDLFPDWYSGQQLLRYFPPLAYYILMGLDILTGDIFRAGSLYMFLAALAGGLSMLLFTGRIGYFWATVAALLYVVFPDHIRVAFAEGNLPRALSTALLPSAFFFLMNLVEHEGRKRDFAGLVVTVAIVVLSHAMMAGIFLLGMGMYAISFWLIARGPFRSAAIGAIGLTAGLFVSAWWMFPSLTGGITELDNEAASEAIAQFPVSVSLNPGLRSGNQEVFYVGLALFATSLAALLFWNRMDRWMKALLPVTIVMTLIGSTFVVEIWRALPAHQLFWPLRFMSFSGIALILTAVGFARILFHESVLPRRRWLRFAALAIPMLAFADAQPSLALIQTRQPSTSVVETAQELSELEGWRVATADLSRLGSMPSMLFTSIGGREQVFGWAFQGSITAPLLARINQAMDQEHLEYAVNRFERLGTDDVVLLPQEDISPRLNDRLLAEGFSLARVTERVQLYHKDGAPRAYSIPLTALGIGSGSNNAALIFPEIVVGADPNLESYDPEFLELFDVIVLSRFEYNDRDVAEQMVTDLAAMGKTIVVDLTSAPLDALSGEPKFLGVYGEPVLQINQARTVINGVVSPLLPFSTEFGEWRSVTPQGADEVVVPFEYIGGRSAAISRNTYEEGEVVFLGLNLMFHAVTTNDPLAVTLLESALGLRARNVPADTEIPLANYVAAQDGWRFEVSLDREQWILFPMAHHDGTRVIVNGEEIPSVGIENLTFAKVPDGQNQVHIRSDRTMVYTVGMAASGVGVLMVVGYLLQGAPAWLRSRARRSNPTLTPAKEGIG